MIARLTKSVNFAPAVVTLAAAAGVSSDNGAATADGGGRPPSRPRCVRRRCSKRAAGFERRTVVVGSGEKVPYLCRPFAAKPGATRRLPAA